MSSIRSICYVLFRFLQRFSNKHKCYRSSRSIFMNYTHTHMFVYGSQSNNPKLTNFERVEVLHKFQEV